MEKSTLDKCPSTYFNNSNVLYNLIFPLWVFPFIPRRVPLAFAVYFVIYTILVWLYLKRHKKFNRLKIYCFRAPGSEKTTLPEINSKVVVRYAFKAAVFGYFADFLGGMVMLGILETEALGKYINTDFLWSNYISGLLHIFVVFLVGFLIYLYHRRLGRSLNLNSAEANSFGFIMGILTAPWFYLIPTVWLY